MSALVLAACASGATPLNSNALVGCGCMDLVRNVDDRVLFQFDKATLRTIDYKVLKDQAVWLAKYPNLNVLVAGNADERGTETYNLALGERRAEVARDALILDGVAPSRITTISYGKDCPVASGNEEATYQQNRNAITSVVGYNPQNCR